jgi:hypothetical protein
MGEGTDVCVYAMDGSGEWASVLDVGGENRGRRKMLDETIRLDVNDVTFRNVRERRGRWE